MIYLELTVTSHVITSMEKRNTSYLMNTCNIIYYGLKVVNQPLLFFSQSYILFTSEPDFLDFKEPSYVDGGKIFFLSFLKL